MSTAFARHWWPAPTSSLKHSSHDPPIRLLARPPLAPDCVGGRIHRVGFNSARISKRYSVAGVEMMFVLETTDANGNAYHGLDDVTFDEADLPRLRERGQQICLAMGRISFSILQTDENGRLVVKGWQKVEHLAAGPRAT